MMRFFTLNHTTSFLGLALCLNTSLYAVSNSSLVSGGNNSDSPLFSNELLISCHASKGFYPINDSGWFIIQNTEHPPLDILFEGIWHKVQIYKKNNALGFDLFKIDVDNKDAQNPDFRFTNLATPEDIKSTSNWVTSLAFISKAFISEGKINDLKEQYSKPLSSISKIKSKENGRLILTPGGDIETAYQELWSKVKRRMHHLYWLNFQHINDLLEDTQYKEKYLERPLRKLIADIQTNQQELNTLKLEIENLKKDFNKAFNMEQDGINFLDQNSLKTLSYLAAIEKINNNINQLEKETDKKLKEKENAKIFHWNEHVKDLKLQKSDCLTNIRKIDKLSYEINSDKKKIIGYIHHNFDASYTGIADKEDNGGLILVYSKEPTLEEHTYKYTCKLAGLTQIKEGNDYIPGEKSIALDLTTPEVHKWISNIMSVFYANDVIDVDSISLDSSSILTPLYIDAETTSNEASSSVFHETKRLGEELTNPTNKKQNTRDIIELD